MRVARFAKFARSLLRTGVAPQIFVLGSNPAVAHAHKLERACKHGHPGPLEGVHPGQVLYRAAKVLGNREEVARWVLAQQQNGYFRKELGGFKTVSGRPHLDRTGSVEKTKLELWHRTVMRYTSGYCCCCCVPTLKLSTWIHERELMRVRSWFFELDDNLIPGPGLRAGEFGGPSSRVD